MIFTPKAFSGLTLKLSLQNCPNDSFVYVVSRELFFTTKYLPCTISRSIRLYCCCIKNGRNMLQVEQWSGDIRHTLTSEIARDILTQLSPGGTLMQGMSHTSMAGIGL